MNMKKLSKDIIDKLKAKGADHVDVISSVSNHEELQFEFGEIDLLRSFQETNISIAVIKDKKHARETLNQLDQKAIDQAIDNVMINVENSQPDPAYAISPFQEPEKFEKGPSEPDRDRMYQLIDEFQSECKIKYPGLMLEGNISHYYRHWFYQNSNGVDFQQNRGGYVYVVMFSAIADNKVSSINYTYGNYTDLKRKFWEVGELKTLIEQSVNSVHARPVPETFEGDVIMVPSITDEFFSYLADYHLTDRLLITGNSLFQNKIGEKLLSDKITVSSMPLNEELAGGYYVNGEGFKAENSVIFENGTLRNYLLSNYGARKSGLPMSKSGGCFIMNAGSDELGDLIASIEKGILLVRFSGGYPSINGDFSGVAKNSFYIENGKISFPINETMISGNLIELFNNVKGISSKRLNNGNSIMPWLKCSGVTISK